MWSNYSLESDQGVFCLQHLFGLKGKFTIHMKSLFLHPFENSLLKFGCFIPHPCPGFNGLIMSLINQIHINIPFKNP